MNYKLCHGLLRGALTEATLAATDPNRVPCFAGVYTPADQHAADVESMTIAREYHGRCSASYRAAWSADQRRAIDWMTQHSAEYLALFEDN
jgi:hypothetical protein